ncbi:DUF2378 family protein [Archangium lansingense]|uniref:DUF2378 family protein n=1 Tax=Archangium lansingense TaxID=2995310 RepID=A0ABT4A0R3_9BACT|nr:DUF2378 family protein [Archangium lansinium]MCY1075203.1 DUF2378 family protein [Archangium lansinium]
MPPAAAAASPQPAPRRMRYAPLEGLLRSLEIHERSAEMKEIIRLSGGTDYVPSEIAVERFAEVLLFLARTRFASLSPSEGLFRVGACLFEGYRKTLLGQIQLAALHLLGPDRLMRKIPEFVGRSSNFGTRAVEQLGPNTYRVDFRGVPLPGDYYNGILHAALRATGVSSPQSSWEQTGPEDMTFEVRW